PMGRPCGSMAGWCERSSEDRQGLPPNGEADHPELGPRINPLWITARRPAVNFPTGFLRYCVPPRIIVRDHRDPRSSKSFFEPCLEPLRGLVGRVLGIRIRVVLCPVAVEQVQHP